jgi:nitroimidazol reductase NimA-like FMN-containing flavoprotein (pyridoxamine 5'-phosphate oxidase superfamily)
MNEHTTMEVLSEAECRRLLASEEVGRVAYVDDDFPVVVPVNYVLDENSIAIHTDAGTKFARIPLHRVAFEVDGIEGWNQSGWSVLVQGFGQDVTDALGARYEDLRRRGLETWPPGERTRWLTIDIQRISGRRIVHRMGRTRETIE